MGYQYKPKMTTGQKVKKFAKRMSLALAFGAAVTGTTMNYYASDEELLVRIENVKVTPPSEPGEAPKMVITTDKGTFVNAPTRMLMKDAADAAEIAQYLREGETLKITVYGLNPKIGKLDRDDFHLYRNIRKVHPGPGQIIIVTPPSTPGDGTIVTPPGQLPPKLPTGTLTDNGLEENQMAPEASAMTSDLDAMSRNVPQLARDLSIMAKLPLTGRPVYDMLTDPANNMRSTLFPVPPKAGSTSTYSDRHARIGRGTGTSTAFHEYFHAYQDVTEQGRGMFDLTVRDAAIANFLTEASAVAYEIASRKEAEKLGLQFRATPVYQERQADGSTMTYTITAPATNPENLKVFDAAYNAALAQNLGEAKALEAGGKAVVRRLLDAQDDQWRSTYAQVAIININNNLHAFGEDGTSAGYAAKRAGVFQRQGKLGDALNFVPEEFLGPQADASIDKTFNAMGLLIENKAKTYYTPVPQQDNAKQRSRAPRVG
jgi:hypothetical protein